MDKKIKMLAGALIGAALGVAAEALIFESKFGKKIRKDIRGIAAEFYGHLSEQAKKMEAVGENEFNNLVRDAAKKFGKIKKLTAH